MSRYERDAGSGVHQNSHRVTVQNRAHNEQVCSVVNIEVRVEAQRFLRLFHNVSDARLNRDLYWKTEETTAELLIAPLSCFQVRLSAAFATKTTLFAFLDS